MELFKNIPRWALLLILTATGVTWSVVNITVAGWLKA